MSATPLGGLAKVPVADLKPSPRNPRQRMTGIDELAASLDTVGMLQPIIAQRDPVHGLVVVAGHRRLAAAKRAGWTHVPCLIRRDLLPDEELAAMLVENGQRSPLDPIEEAHALNHLLGMLGTQAAVAQRIGRSTATVSLRLGLLNLSLAEQEAVRRGELQVGVARQVIRERTGNKTRNPRWHLGKDHPLAGQVRDTCKAAGHSDVRKVGGMGCGRCWEQAIRLDERTQLRRAGAA